MKHDAITAEAVANFTPDQIKDMALQLAVELPYAKQCELIRALAEGMSWSRGVDKIDVGLDWIEEDLKAEEEQAHSAWSMPDMRTVGVMPVALNPDAWKA